MKLTTIIGTAIAAVGLAACGSTTVTPTRTPAPAATPTLAPTPTATPTAAPSPIPTPKPEPKLGVYVTTTCGVAGTAQGGSVTFHGVKPGEWMGWGSDPEIMKFPTVTYGPVTVGRWTWSVWDDPKVAFVARGTFTIPACPGKTI
jgi:hypothetical protein